MHPTLENAFTRLGESIDSIPPDRRAESDRRYEAMLESEARARPQRVRSRAGVYKSYMQKIVSKYAAEGPERIRAEIVGPIAHWMVATFGMPPSDSHLESARKVIAATSGQAVIEALGDLIQEQPKDIRSPWGLLTDRARGKLKS